MENQDDRQVSAILNNASRFEGKTVDTVRPFTYPDGTRRVHIRFEGTGDFLELASDASDTGPGFVFLMDDSSLADCCAGMEAEMDFMSQWTDEAILQEFEAYMDGEGLSYTGARVLQYDDDYNWPHDKHIVVECRLAVHGGDPVEYDVSVGPGGDHLLFEEV